MTSQVSHNAGLEQPSNASRISESTRLVLLLTIIGVYLALCLPFLPKPGLEYDEVLYGDAALGSRGGSFVPYEWKLGGFRVPVMLMTYIGAVRAWLYTPIFALFGVNPWTVRLPMIALGAITLFCVERLVRPMFGVRVALLATALLAIDPSFLFGTREDYGFISIMLATKTASLALLAYFVETRRRLHLFIAFFLLGIGLFDKFNFAWHIGALGVASLVIWPQVRPFLRAKNVGLATLGILAGCWPLLVYNIVTHGGTLSGVEPEPSLHDAFVAKYGAIRATLEGTAFPAFALGAAPGPATLLPWVLILSMPAAAAGRRHIPLRWLGFCWAIVISVAGAILVTPKATGGHHAMMLWPFVHIVIAAAATGFVDTTIEWPGGRAAATGLAPIVLLASFFSSISLDIRTLAAYRQSGGHGFWSDAIYELADTVAGDAAHRYLFMDWGMFNQVRLLSGGKARGEEAFWALTEPGREDAQVGYLHEREHDPENLFVFMAPGRSVFVQPRQVFELTLERYRLKEDVLKTFRELDGSEAYRIVRTATGSRVPERDRFTASSDRGWLRAKRVSDVCINGTAVFAFEWSAPGVDQTEVHVSSPDGPLFSRAGTSGAAITEQWVTPGMTFYLQDTSPNRKSGANSTVTKLQTTFDCR